MTVTVSELKEMFGEHVLWDRHDPFPPNCITDSNGEIVLALCKVCGRGEADLQLDDGKCPGRC